VSATDEALQQTREGPAERLRTRLIGQGLRPEVFGRRQRETLLLGLVFGVMVAVLIHGPYGLNVATNAALYALLSLGFFYQFALGGQFSFATPTFYAVGAYAAYWSTKHGGFLVSVLFAAACAAALGFLVKLLLSRSPLIQFAIATLAFGQLGIIVLRNWHHFTNGDQGLYNIPTAKIFGYNFNTPTKEYLLVAGFVLIGAALAILFERSPAQRDLAFTRDMDVVARTVGLRATLLQASAFAVGAAYMGVAGSLFVHTSGFVSTTSFSVDIALSVLLMVLLGGTGSVWGPVVGAIVLTLAPQVLSSWSKYQDLIYAGMILLVIMVLPGGIVSLPHVIRRRLTGRGR
jgi:branched-chain amino acid transport system permease protein